MGSWRPGSIPAGAYVLASALWCAAALLVKPFYPYVDFDAFYATAMDRILAGAPLDLYAFVARPPGSDLAIPLSHPPVWFFLLAPWYGLGRWLGFTDFHRSSGMSYGQAWMLIVSLPLDLLLCRTVLRLAEGAKRFAEPGRWWIFVCLLFSPLLWLSSVRYGHNEAAMALLVLLAVAAAERSRPALSGVLWGVALGIKTTAVVPALAFYGWGLGRGRRRATATSAAVAVATFLAPLLPYWLFRREQVSYALLGFEGLRPVGGYVAWKLLPDPAAAAACGNLLILASAAALGLAMARRPGRTFLSSGGAWALVLGQMFLLLLAKAVYVWYALAASCFLYLAVARERRGRGAIPCAPLAASLLLWILQGGAWVGERVDPPILVRAALWASCLLAIGATAAWALFARREQFVPDEPGRPGI